METVPDIETSAMAALAPENEPPPSPVPTEVPEEEAMEAVRVRLKKEPANTRYFPSSFAIAKAQGSIDLEEFSSSQECAGSNNDTFESMATAKSLDPVPQAPSAIPQAKQVALGR